MTNEEWLEHLAHNDIPGLRAWFKAEHVESPESGALVQCAQIDEEGRERAAESDTASENADSRELILTDLEKKTREWHDYDGNFMRIYSGVAYAQMKELLDRQAAVTEEKTRYKWVTASAEEIAAWRSKAEKLKEQVYELTTERDKLQEQLLIGWECECRLQAERDNLAADLMRANNERERYREKFGKCIDYADAIHALMDEGMA